LLETVSVAFTRLVEQRFWSAGVVGSVMRYFNAAEITRPEADYIRLTCNDSLSSTLVITLGSKWYDVRGLTHGELRSFVEQLLRDDQALMAAGRITPH
jgi:hypothetical protein